MGEHKEIVMDYKTGQIYGWNGGKPPVHPKSVVQVWFRSGGLRAANAQVLVWDHNQNGHDIVCFQVVKPYAEPKVIYVNEYANGDMLAYPSEKEAEAYKNSRHTRVAVKYVEEKE